MERLYQVHAFDRPFAFNMWTGELAVDARPVASYRFYANSIEEAKEVAARKYQAPLMTHLQLAKD